MMMALLTALVVSSSAQPMVGQDTIVVRADNPPVWGEDLGLVEELRIGVIDGDLRYVFGYLMGVAPGPQGTVYVVDQQVPVVRQYDRNGVWLRDVGREGDGPGEYRVPLGMSYPEGLHLALYDPRAARVTLYQDGEYFKSFSSSTGLFTADLFQADTAGNVYVKTTVVDTRAVRSGEEWSMAWIKFGPDGTVLDSIAIPMDESDGPSYVLSGRGGYFRPFTTMTVSTMSPHGYLVQARNDRYAVTRPLPDGRTLRIERTAEVLPVTRAERAEWEAWSAFFDQRDDGRAKRKNPPIPTRKPFIRHLFVDGEGRIWVARYAKAEHRPYTPAQRAERGERPDFEWRQPLVWDVLTPRGAFLGTVTFPPSTSLAAARGNRVWGIQSGELGEDYVVRFRIQR